MKKLFTFLMALALLSACSGGSSGPREGHWTGKHYDGSPLSFDVEGGQIKNFSMKLRMGMDTCTVALESIPVNPDGTVKMSVKGGDAWDMTAEFKSSTEFAGQVDTILCGGQMSVFFANNTFTASPEK